MAKNFSGKNLRGRSFKRQDLKGANFRKADIRGADFREADIRGANFSNAQAGLQRRWLIFLIVVSLLLTAIFGATSGVTGAIASGMLRSNFIKEYGVVPSVTSFVLLGFFFIVTVRQEFTSAIGTLVVVLFVATAVFGTLKGGLDGNAAAAIAVAGAVVGVAGLAVAVAIAGIEAGSGAGVAAIVIAISVASFVAGSPNIAVFSTGTGSVARAVAAAKAESEGRFVAVVVAGVVTLLASYVGQRAITGDKKSTVIRRTVIATSALGGTSFCAANLTDANFTRATLKSTKFIGATLTRTCFHKARQLDCARLGGTYLENRKVQQLVITGAGQNENFDRLYLRGVNLTGAKLADASFIGADLSEANLQDADLSRAKLVQTQLDEADLTGATLTEATIEDWGITSHTKLHGMRCEYVFMRLPTKDDPNPRRKPDNWNENFEDGEFADFITPIVKTLDLYHSQNVDARAVAIAYRQLVENHPEAELEIVAIEIRGKNKDKFRLRAETSENANHSELNAEYFDNYSQLKSLPQDSLLLLLTERNNKIRRLETMIANALIVSRTDTETVQNQVRRQRGKQVIIRLGMGDFETGFPEVTALIFEDDNRHYAQYEGQLPPNQEILTLYYHWQAIYYGLAGLSIPKYNSNKVTYGSKKQLHQLEEELRKCLNTWLDSEQFRTIEQQVRDNLNKSEEVQLIIQTKDIHLRRLPWHLWDFFETYRKTEMALSAPVYERVETTATPRSRVRILGILGDSTGIDIEKDRQLLEKYAEPVFLPERPRTELLEHLWNEQGWDILCFSGHSSSEWDGRKGWIYINKTDKLTIDYLKTALRAAIEQGLQLAIFNSCDGLGLASQLAALHIPQIIVMREPVPDVVAQEFLKNFLTAFAGGKSFYLAVRQAREKLQALEDECPSATWLPIICQNPAEVPPTWQDLNGIKANHSLFSNPVHLPSR
jgi:uncharacterized protein YjbI with pentapeptide repeats